jgi:hypothetical protein
MMLGEGKNDGKNTPMQVKIDFKKPQLEQNSNLVAALGHGSNVDGIENLIEFFRFG